ncbi:SDR family oxidoreductase [Brenneria corticis]|uniref:NAD(P)-dependent oxidoreductase n=1 Tax=Brenneria corticis TaxID=2173106 RepID=A0A2U1TVE2_9GAMM|nr:SDR family oxidoreductase [Brenneria sp. CFCC 11842]PWC13368.1 NAD(P)-dependent oxidoreductase [Brenneria sp. CFCC 11842]
MPSLTSPTLLVTGASGHLGRRVVEYLLDGGAANVVAATRNPDGLADLAARGAETRKADFDDPATLQSAFAGVDRLLIVSAPDTPDDPSRRRRQHLAAVDAALKAGVRHIVYTSMLNPEPGSPIPFAPDHYGTEQAIEKSGIPFTILRPSWYADSVFLWLPPVLAAGQWYSAAGDGRTAHVWRDDLAKTAAAALVSATEESRRLAVTGPQALTPAEIVDIVNRVFDTRVELIPVSDADLRNGLTAAKLPAGVVELLTAIDINTRQGGVDVVGDAVERLTGEPPRSLHDFLVDNRAALLAARDALNP